MRKKYSIAKLLNKPTSLSEIFHQKTKLKRLTEEKIDKKWPKEWKKVYFKAYSRMEEILLPQSTLKKVTLEKTLKTRKSVRNMNSSRLSLKEMSPLLYWSAGIKKINSTNSSKRFYPSAGGRYPLEIYLISMKSELPNGLYHYYLKHNSLEKLLLFDNFYSKKYFKQAWISRASCLVIITALFKRTITKYGDRGYRHILMEAGHLGQNIYLVSSALDISCCAIGGFIDEKLNNLLDIDGINESIIYVLAVGKEKVT